MLQMDELKESELGTREFWDNRYKEEIANFKDYGDVGEIWFGENTVDRILNWFKKQKIGKNATILDVGCGNGQFLIELSKNGYRDLTGIDYSIDGIELAKSIAENDNQLNINFRVGDVLEGINGQFDLIHDKGTYDAISLSLNSKENRLKYLDNIWKGLNDSSFFIITCCNWTREELNEQFMNKLKEVDYIPAPQFQFGGKTGSQVSTVIYQKLQC